MKKPKISLDSAKFQALFIQHVEKVLLGIVIGLAIFLVYQGFSLPGLEDSSSPKGLLDKTQEVRSFIDAPDRWDKDVMKTRQFVLDIGSKVIEYRSPTDPAAYYLASAWSKPSFPKLSPRRDPEMYPPQDLKVVGIIGPLAVVNLDGPAAFDPLEPLPSEDEDGEAPKAKPKAKAPKAKKAKANPLDPLNPGGRPTRNKRGGEGAAGVGDASILEEGVSAEDMSAAASGYGMSSAAGGSGPNAINPESVLGYVGTQASKAQQMQAIVVMAVVPYEKQLEEFHNALAESLDYDPVRDTPLYLQFFVERADVTDDPAAALETLTWARLGVSAALAEARSTWAGAQGEIVDLRYLDPPTSAVDAGLTHPAPPFMQRDPWEILTHPQVPLAPLATSGSDLGPDGRPRTPRATKSGAATPVDDEPVLGPLTGQESSGGSGFSTGGSAMPRPGAVSGGMPSMPGMAMPGMEGAAAMDEFGNPVNLAPPKYKLIRYTDTSPEIGHQYRYRVKVLVHDPNNPATGFVPPSAPALDLKVQERLKTAKTYYVESAWSEPSPVASLPDTNRYFASSVTVTKPTPVKDGKPPVPVTQPSAAALAVVWDSGKVADIPGQANFFRGSVLNFTTDTQTIHPAKHMPVELPAYRVATGALIADMMGGDEIPVLDKRNDKDPLKAPGELLIFDAAGNLHVRDEAEDVEGFRRYLVPESEVPEAQPAGGAPAAGGGILGMPMPGAPAGMGGPAGMGPVGPKRGKK